MMEVIKGRNRVRILLDDHEVKVASHRIGYDISEKLTLDFGNGEGLYLLTQDEADAYNLGRFRGKKRN